jgi:Holliday junction resolvasome RuvABC endonuclease subunit
VIGIGVDAGRRHFGFAAVETVKGGFRIVDFGVGQVTGSGIVSKCGWAFEFTRDLAKKWNPRVWGLEYSNFKGMGNGALIGATAASMAQTGGEVYLLYPSRIRMMVAGRGNASKQEVKRVLRAYGLPGRASAHSGDAAAAALAALLVHRSPLK